jgi:hypothetical protein
MSLDEVNPGVSYPLHSQGQPSNMRHSRNIGHIPGELLELLLPNVQPRILVVLHMDNSDCVCNMQGTF